MHTSLPEENDLKPKMKTELIISGNKQKSLSREQIAFNRLIKKIEKLRLEVKKTSDHLDHLLAFYGKEIHPLEKKANEHKKEILRILYPHYKSNKKIKGEERKTFKRFILSFLEDILSRDSEPPGEDLQDIFKEVTGESFEEAVTEDFEMLKEEMKNQFRENGFDFDFGELHKDMSREEISARMREFYEKMENQKKEAEAQKPKKKKTAKQIEKEEKNKQIEEARNKSIKSIYKQLVKALHPDLEQDEFIKAKKERLMQRLTVAYQHGDLHEMLTLEMEFIGGEENNIDQLSTEKLGIYNKVLKEQIQALEVQKFGLLHQSQFIPLLKYAGLNNILTFNLQAEKKKLTHINHTMEHSLKKLKGKSFLSEIKQILYHFEMSEWSYLDEDEEEDWDW